MENGLFGGEQQIQQTTKPSRRRRNLLITLVALIVVCIPVALAVFSASSANSDFAGMLFSGDSKKSYMLLSKKMRDDSYTQTEWSTYVSSFSNTYSLVKLDHEGSGEGEAGKEKYQRYVLLENQSKKQASITIEYTQNSEDKKYYVSRISILKK